MKTGRKCRDNIKTYLRQKRSYGAHWIVCLRIVAGPFEHGNETRSSVKCRERLDWLNKYELLKKDAAA
jgi:hypothetical protein